MTVAQTTQFPRFGEQGCSEISEDEFTRFQRLIYQHAGIALSRSKKALLEARLIKRLRELGLTSFKDYYACVVDNPDGAELIQLLDCICTNETHFFREPKQFEFLEQRVFPLWMSQAAAGERERRIRLWSAACSTGEEPYSLAMLLENHFANSAGWDIEILATDLSTRALGAAQNASWPIAKASEIPQEYLKRFMLRGVGSQTGKMKAGPEILSLVRFHRLNLNDDTYPLPGRFDAIFCRNVLIYFDAESRRRVIENLLDFLSPDGFLFVGHAETLSGVTERARHIMPTIYGCAENATIAPIAASPAPAEATRTNS